MISQQKFPKDFLWGASTASHQVEGGTVNQWSKWELEHAAELAAGAEKRLGNLPDWKDIREQAQNPENYVSGQGVDHYNCYEEDFDLLEKLQFNTFRFGIEWSRIEPEEGAFNLDEIKHYHKYIDSLNRRGITPVLNLWHWTMPTWFTDKGGFEKKENLPLFEEYVQKIAEEYGNKVEYFITLNEPNIYASFGYINAEWPPQQKSYQTFFKVYRNLVIAHHRAYAILKAANAAAQVGIAAQLANIQSKRPHNVVDGIVTKVMRYGWNWWFLNRIRYHQDFVGINYYFTDYYRGFNGKDTPRVPVSDLGWYMEPEGLYPLLLRTWARYKKPIIITENGVADRNDSYREWWLEQTVIAMQRALSEGVQLKGYMHWSLLDNFEWAYGWWPKFGLVAVDREHDMKRTPRPSAIWFARYLMELQGKKVPKKRQKDKVSLLADAEGAASKGEGAGEAAAAVDASSGVVPKKPNIASRIRQLPQQVASHTPTARRVSGRNGDKLNLKRFRSKIQ
jgi:beta-glucosidase